MASPDLDVATGGDDMLITPHEESDLEMDGVDRDRALAGAFVAGSVLLLGVLASTIDDVVGGTGGMDVEVTRPGAGFGEVNATLTNGSAGGGGPVGESGTIDLIICIDALTTTPAILGIVAVIGTLLFGVYRRYNAATSLLVGTGIVPVVWGTYFFLTNCIGSGAGGMTLFSGASVVTNEGGIGAPAVPPAVLAGVFGVVVVGGLAVLATTAGSRPESSDPVPEEVGTADVARTVGRAADRIQTADVPPDNAVYRAWRELTALLDVENPETTAPEDFARAAIDLGLDEDHVDELTELFRDVRYGGKSAERREDRAVEIFRRIEESYRPTPDGAE